MKQLLERLNKLVVERMEIGIKEHIADSQANEALEILESLEVRTTEDVLLFCAAMNLLNTYVKQPDRKLGYSFKAYLDYLFVALLENNIQNVNVGMDITVTKKGGAVALVIIQIENVQFSFHQIKMSDEALDLKLNSDVVKDLVFDGTRKQMCASTIFEMVKML